MKKLIAPAFLVVAIFGLVAVLADELKSPPTIEWDPVTQYSDGRSIEPDVIVRYNVYRSVNNPTNFLQVAQTTNTFYADTNVTLSATYRYRVAPQVYGIEADPSPIVTFMSFAPAKITSAPRVRQ